jgi:hypothetical protein
MAVVLVKYAFVISCGFVLGALVVEYKDYFSHQIPVPVAILADGGLYDGELRKGLLDGKGRLSWPSKSYYEGEFKDGLFHGKGLLHTPAFLYAGDFELGNAMGEGTITYINGDKYQGQVVFGLPNGYGVLETATGENYKGAFVNNRYQGQGEWSDGQGDSYVGGFVNGLFDGIGVYKSILKHEGDSEVSEPKIYSGIFNKGQFTGEGVWINGDQRYEGDFVDWLFYGKGLYSDAKGTYFGDFVAGVFQGEGVYTASNGASYEGEFLSGLYHGNGVLNTVRGDVYRGQFQYGLKHGEGVLTYAEVLDGIQEIKGEWKYDELVKANHPNLAIPKSTLVEYALYHQADMLNEALSQLAEQNPEAIDMYFVGVAGDGNQGVFRREIDFVKTFFDEHYGTKGKSISLINSPFSYDSKPLATVTSIQQTLQAVTNKMDEDNDILFLYLTSHGSRDFQLQLSQPGLALASLSAKELGSILHSLPVRHKVVVISACYSGGFIIPIKDDNMLIITAAEADKTSFGCHDLAQMTYFGEAFFKDALPKSSSFVDSFYRARDIVRGREAKENIENSNPQLFKSQAIVTHLAKWRQQMAQQADDHNIPFLRPLTE